MLLNLRESGIRFEHNEKNIEEFINNVMSYTEDKERKVFEIHVLQEVEGKQNMVLYYQDGIVKSHHSSWGEFDYKDILKYEIAPFYRVREICLNDILSVGSNNKSEMEKNYERKIVKWDNIFLNCNNSDDLLKEMFDEKKLEKFKEIQGDEEVNEVVSILCEEVLNNKRKAMKLKNTINKNAEDIYILEEKMKWLNDEIIELRNNIESRN